ncbi:hypothetical protein MNV49_006710 [Pseudohyphozyma bogoriensis]|nr:hypothetical protein MNV49_006710 [Pseudohyphozyma bogoriensis]
MFSTFKIPLLLLGAASTILGATSPPDELALLLPEATGLQQGDVTSFGFANETTSGFRELVIWYLTWPNGTTNDVGAIASLPSPDSCPIAFGNRTWPIPLDQVGVHTLNVTVTFEVPTDPSGLCNDTATLEKQYATFAYNFTVAEGATSAAETVAPTPTNASLATFVPRPTTTSGGKQLKSLSARAWLTGAVAVMATSGLLPI